MYTKGTKDGVHVVVKKMKGRDAETNKLLIKEAKLMLDLKGCENIAEFLGMYYRLSLSSRERKTNGFTP